MKKFISVIFATSLLVSLFAASVKRDADFKDLNSKWNELDVQQVTTSVVKKMSSSNRIIYFETDNDRLPVVIVGKIQNESSERIDTSVLEKRLQNEMINSGLFDFVSEREEKNILRNEVLDQAEHASDLSAKDIDEELAADFMLNGNIKTIEEVGKKLVQKTYYITIQLVDISSHKIIFTSEEKISKTYKPKKVRF